MATASPHTTMLREITAAGDRERTGAFDLEWEGAHATLFFMFGHPTHAVFETADGRKLVGEPALDAIVEEMPTDFRIAPWRRAMVTDDTLRCSAEDLMGLFQRRNAVVQSNDQAKDIPGEAAAKEAPADTPAAAVEVAPHETAATTPAPAEEPPAQPVATNPLPFGLHDFPLLPLASTLWTDAAANVSNLEAALPRLPDCFIVLSGPTSRGLVVVSGGNVSDAMWVNTTSGRTGGDAAQAVMNSIEGTLTAYQADDPRISSALPMLWRSPRLGSGLPGGWLHIDDVVAEVRTSGRSCALVVDGADAGVALFLSGELVAVYTTNHPWPATSMASLRDLLHQAGARITVLGGIEHDEPSAVPSAEPISGDVAAEAPEAVADSADAELTAQEAAAPETAAPEATASEATVTAAPEESAASEPKGRGRRSRDKKANDVAELPTDDETAELAAVAEPANLVVEPDADAVPGAPESADPDPEPAITEPVVHAAVDIETAADAWIAADTSPETAADTPPEVQADQVDDVRFEPAVFTIADLSEEAAADPSGMSAVEAREATEFVPARLDIDIDSLRGELSEIATSWLGEVDGAPVTRAIASARAGVDDFVSTIRAIGAMEIPGHETAVVRAMAREMHYRATEVLTGV